MVHFSALGFNITYTNSAGAKVPFDHENVHVCSFSNTYCNHYFCPFLLMFWVLLLNGLGLEEQIASFLWHFPFRNLKVSLEIWPLVHISPPPPFISRIKYPATSTEGEGVDLCVAGYDPAWESVLASWSRYCSYISSPGLSPEQAIKQSRTYTSSPAYQGQDTWVIHTVLGNKIQIFDDSYL